MLPELQNLGLSEKEARVYLAALELGPTTAEKLSAQAKVNRSTTYVQLESLMKAGLMSTYEEGKKTYFAPESPELLKRLLAKQKDAISTKERDLTSLLPELLRQYEGAGERPVVRFYSGKEGITTMREDALNVPKGGEIKIIYSYDALRGIYSEKEADEYTKKRTERGLRVRYIYTRKAGKLSDQDLSSSIQRRYVAEGKMPLSSDFFIYGDKLAIMALRGSLFGVVIESKQIADSFRALFEVVWSVGEE